MPTRWEKTKGKVCGILLAAGSSKRLGLPKQLLPLGRITLLEKVLKACLDSQLDGLILVLGHAFEEVMGIVCSYNDLRLKVVRNLDYQLGLSSSIRLGLKNLSQEEDAFMILLGDMPFINAEVIDSLLNRFWEAGKPCCAYWICERPVHPVIFHSSLRHRFESLEGDRGGRHIIEELAGQGLVEKVKPPFHLPIGLDVDTLEDYREVLKILKA